MYVIHIYIYIHTCVYIYIYIEREREIDIMCCKALPRWQHGATAVGDA